MPDASVAGEPQWDFVGASAGAGLPGSLLLQSGGTLSECLALCAANTSCTAVDYVAKLLGEPSVSAVWPTSLKRQTCGHSRPRKWSCWDVTRKGWQPCVQPLTENVAARKIHRPLPPSGAKNVLLVIFDDLRVIEDPAWKALTPTMSNFADSATSFLSAHAQSALCGPSRASLLSGRRPDVTRVWWTDQLPRAHPRAEKWITLPQHFKENGYYVAAAGKMFHATPDPLSHDPMSWSEPECVRGYPYYGQGKCPESAEYCQQRFQTSSACPVDRLRHPEYEHTDERVLQKATGFLRRASSLHRRFWIGAGFFKPHKPHIFPTEVWARVPSMNSVRLPSNGKPPLGLPLMSNIPELCALKLDEESYRSCARENIRSYHAAASWSDSLMAQLLAEVRRLGQQNETLTVVMSDHGFALGEHGSWAKWTNWDVATRVPLMISAPWQLSSVGQRISTVVELVDLFPTVAELAGLEIIHGAPGYAALGGQSLASVMLRPRNATTGAAFSQIARCWPEGGSFNLSSLPFMAQCDKIHPSNYAYVGYSIRTAAFRLTKWVRVKWDASSSRLLPQWSESMGVEMYDHHGNAGGESAFLDFENVNIAAERPAVVAELDRRLRTAVDATQALALRHHFAPSSGTTRSLTSSDYQVFVAKQSKKAR